MNTELMPALGRLVGSLETIGSLKRRGIPDSEQLEFAAAENWTIFTFDTGDFSRLHWEWTAAGRTHAGIILETNSLLPVGELLRRFTRLFDSVGDGTLAGRLLYLGDYR